MKEDFLKADDVPIEQFYQVICYFKEQLIFNENQSQREALDEMLSDESMELNNDFFIYCIISEDKTEGLFFSITGLSVNLSHMKTEGQVTYDKGIKFKDALHKLAPFLRKSKIKKLKK